ncbi:MAG: efflux RND transporter periplasmic adaptor subunit [Gammaproteobacteria bacterium]|nr:efflux RND transporter periplasmic adaptor subunit [Gammaproteobacteria bacterium]MDP2141823.1 efflux RND transporter periplasmic adaptor subunit [Gammaproteobacteria bacterium]MDP2348314.1 efflux RND transporter periplasmic adaptor subunit [Gammaproteobacteria bacterium]
MLLFRNRRTLKLSLMALAVYGVLATGVLYSIRPVSEVSAADVVGAPMPVVETITVEYTPLRTWNTFSGRLKAVDEADIRPLVGGTIQQVLFEDGALVEAGQTLFVIDPRPFEAALQHARATLASAQSDAALARVEFERADGLALNNVISRSVRDNRENDLNVALARLEAARAQVVSAELNLDYAHVKAPFAGRIGRAEVTAGNVIEAGPNAPLLASIVSIDRLYAEFAVDESTYFNVSRSADGISGEGSGSDTSVIPVDIVLGGSDDDVYHGRLHAFDNQLDVHSGTIRARAIIENQDHSLIPGVFVSVRLGTAIDEPTLLIPERAIGVNQDKRFVYVVNADDRVEYRELHLGRVVDSQRVVLGGLARGDRVITNGVQRVMSDMQVIVAAL